MNNTSMNINFRGFGVRDAVPAQKVQKFLNNENNLKLIDELDKKNIDVFMTSKGSELHFISQKYGDLKKYGLSELVEEADQITSNLPQFLRKINRTCTKAAMDIIKQKQKQAEEKAKLSISRGC